MNDLKIAYVVCSLIQSIVLVVLAIVIPIWLTPGYYWWSSILLFLIIVGSHGLGKRMDLWTGSV